MEHKDNPWEKKTEYIWLPQGDSREKTQPLMVFFRRELHLMQVPDQVLVQISADTRYRIMVNGSDVCCGPCKGDSFVWYYEQVDLAPFLVEGENVIAVKVLRYPQESGLGCFSMFRTEVPHLYFHEVEGKLGISADEQWQVKVCEGIRILPEDEHSRYLWNKEMVDGHLLENGWDRPGGRSCKKREEKRQKTAGQETEERTGWRSARAYRSGEVPLGRSPRNLMMRPIPLLPETEKRWQRISCIRQSETSKEDWQELIEGKRGILLAPGTVHVIELDAGQETTAYPLLEITGGENSEIEMLWAESYCVQNEEGKWVKRDRQDWKRGRLSGYTDTYVAGGSGTKEDPERYVTFTFRTFRFLKLTVRTGKEPLLIRKIAYRETGYPLESRSQVEASEREMDAIWQLSLRTLQCCMHETYEDCPYYEQLQYAMDTRAQILFTYCVSADDRLARKCIEDFHRSLRPDGMINCCYPSMHPNLIPGFALYYIFMIHDHMMYFGDRKLVESYFLTVERILQFFEERTGEDGLVGRIGGYNGEHPFWSFIDWTQQWKWGVPNAIRRGPLTMESMLYLMAMQKTAEMAGFLEKDEKQTEYEKKICRLKKAIIEKCYDEEKGLFQDGPGYTEDYSQHSQVFAVLTGLAEKEKAAALMKKVLHGKRKSVGEKFFPLTECSVAMSFYYFRALELAGLYDEAACETWEPWREMLRNHMTTCMESTGEGRSDCHAWGATALYEFPSVILGVRPIKPGYEEAMIRPHPAFLNWARGTVATPRGNIKVEWKKDEQGKIQLQWDESEYRGKVYTDCFFDQTNI